MYKEYDVVALKTELPSAELKASEIGTILMVYSGPTRAYEVEFAEAAGTFTVPEEQLVPAMAPVAPEGQIDAPLR